MKQKRKNQELNHVNHMNHNTWKLIGAVSLCAVLAWTSPISAKAAVKMETSTTLYAKIDVPNVVVRAAGDEKGAAIIRASKGQTYEVAAPPEGGWVKIRMGAGEGYIPENRTTLFEKTTNKVDEGGDLRGAVVDYALQFVGNPYVYGGSDPNTGADCSGFTRYVMQHAAGVSLAHSSRAQANEGRSISYGEAKPGDLLFYGSGRHIAHVALYIGGGKIVHASTERTGIKISKASYSQPIKVVDVLD